MMTDTEHLSQCIEEVLKLSQAKGATQAEVSASTGQGFSVNVRLGEVETVEFHRDRGIGVTVYYDQQRGSASTNEISFQALEETVQAACDIAKCTQPDPYAGLAEPHRLAYDYPDLDLHHPWDLSVEEAIEKAKTCEQVGCDYDRFITNSEGASVSTGTGVYAYGNSHGFLGVYPSSQHNISCSFIAEKASEMQRDYSYTANRNPHHLQSVQWVGQEAAKRTIARLGAKSIPTCQAPILFVADVARGLLASLMSAAAGSRIYRKSSFLCDHLGKQIFPTHFDIYESPHLLGQLGSAPFDAEGALTTAKKFVEGGVLTSYVLSSYSARQLKMTPTGNAGGVHNLRITDTKQSFEDLVKTLDKGLIVTSLMGQGINLLTGDYSRGASGFWVEQGQIQHPVDEVTIAGNLKEMFANIVAIGQDIDLRGNICTGSILLESMTIAGA
jgi:PmbA protein